MGVAAEPAAGLTDPATGRAERESADVVAVFAVLWALAALFHILGPSQHALDVIHNVTLVGASHVIVGLAALAVLAAPRSMVPLVGLAVISSVSAWLEAPFLGNHWLVVAFVDLALVGAVLVARGGRSVDLGRFAAILLPLARWTLIVFYSFAAISKLNHGFFSTSSGCGTFYFDELAGSLGLSTPLAVGHGGWAHLVPVAVAGTELSVPVLLLCRRTRNAGVVLGLVFHSLIALDQTHLFSDFSSVVAALFVLFLPPAFAVDVVGAVERRARAATGAQLAVLGAFGLTLAFQWTATGDGRLFTDLRMMEWFVVDGAVLAVVLTWVVRARRARLDRPLALAAVPRWLWLVPLLVFGNGLTPYLELKTAYGFNMYSNLVTAGGSTNSFLVPRTFPIHGDAGDLVRIEHTDDGVLRLYATLHYDVPYLSLRTYLADHPSVAIPLRARRHRTRPGPRQRRSRAGAAREPARAEAVRPPGRRPARPAPLPGRVPSRAVTPASLSHPRRRV